MKKEDNSIFDVNLELDELFRSTFGEPIIDVNLSFEETMKCFFDDLQRSKSLSKVSK